MGCQRASTGDQTIAAMFLSTGNGDSDGVSVGAATSTSGQALESSDAPKDHQFSWRTGDHGWMHNRAEKSGVCPDLSSHRKLPFAGAGSFHKQAGGQPLAAICL